MKIRGAFDWGYPQNIFKKTCDELCNDVYTVGIPYVGYLSLFREQVMFEQGYWFASGASGNMLDLATYTKGGVYVLAYVPSTKEAIDDDLFGENNDAHPRIWMDSEVHALATQYEYYSEEEEDFLPIGKDFVWQLIERNPFL